MNIVANLFERGLISPPKWLPGSIQYLVRMGSEAYGVKEDGSDTDLYGICIPHKDTVFPHLTGEIPGFGTQKKRFDNWQEHHILDKEKQCEYDCDIYSIVRYFHLAMDGTPNIIDSLFVPLNKVTYMTAVGQKIRENRHMFLHKGLFHRFLGYAHSQLHKMSGNKRTGKRAELHEKYGFDVKFAYNLVRLSDEIEQILSTHDLDLQKRREHLKAIRRGEVSEKDIRNWFSDKEKHIESLYHTSTLPYKPDEPKIKALLIECLEMYFGDLNSVISFPEKDSVILDKIQDLLEDRKSSSKEVEYRA